MNTKNFSTLQVFQTVSGKGKSHFLQSCPEEFIRFLCECIVYLLKGKLQAIKRHHVVKFQDESWLVSQKRTFWNQRSNVLSSEKALQLLAVITPPVINHLSCYLKIFLPSIFNSVDFWNGMSLIVLDIELTQKKLNKELGLFIEGSVKGFSFCPPKTFKPNKQTTWNTKRLHGIAWSNGKLEYEKLFSVFYDIKVMNAEVSARRFEKCRQLTRLLGQNVEKLDDYGCPIFQDLVGEGKANSSWICSSYPFWHTTRLHCAERIAKVNGDWAMQHLNL